MGSELFERNFAALQSFLPDGMAQKIGAIDPLENGITGSLEAGDLNARIGGQLLYQSDALTDAFNAVQNYVQQPSRLFGEIPSKRDTLWESFGGKQRYHERINERLIDRIGDAYVSPEPQPDAGYMVMFGLGLGIQIPLLMDRIAFRNLVIIEPDPVMWRLSLQVLPWEGLLQRLAGMNGRLTVYASPDPAQTADEAIQVFRDRDYALFDGSYLYQQSDSPYFQQLIPRFRDMLSTRINAMGFFEDECIMMRHTLQNLSRFDCHLMPADITRPRNMPAMIVASGPSVDGCLEQIKKVRDRAVLFSGGTGIGTLLEHDILPDYHCEGENVTTAYDSLIALKDVARLKEVTLIAPSTIDPRLVPLFGKVIFYFRDSVTPTRLLAQPGYSVTLAGPTVANLACRAALTMGFPELLLFGVDFGSTSKTKHHSASSIYFTIGDEYWEKGAGISAFSLKVPGNLRKTVHTNRNFIHARAYLEKLLSLSAGQRIYNFSDGAHIQGAEPAKVAKLQLKMPFYGPDKVTEAIARDFPNYRAGESLDKDLTDRFQQEARQWFNKVETILGDNSIEDVLDLHDALLPLMQQGQADMDLSAEAAMRAMPSGSLFLILQSLHFLCRRVDPALAADLVRLCRSSLAEMLPDIRSELDAALQGEGWR